MSKKLIELLVIFIVGMSFNMQVNAKDEQELVTVTPVPQPDWWSARHAEKLEQVKKQTVDLLMIGDSITHSWEWTGQKVWQKYYASRNGFNLGYGGDRTENVLWRLQNGEIEGISPKLTVLMIGTNNTSEKHTPQATAMGIKRIIEVLQTRLPTSKILLLAIFTRGETPDDELRQQNEKINKIISGYANNQDIHYLDINSSFLDNDGNLSRDIMPDLLHPSEIGYEIWAEAMEPVIKKLMGN